MNKPVEHAECPFCEKLLAYLSEELSDREATALELHLHDCPDCLHTLVEMRRVQNTFQLVALLTRLQSATAPAAARASTLITTVLRAVEVVGRHSGGQPGGSRLRRWREQIAANAEAMGAKLSNAGRNLKELHSASAEFMQEFGWMWLQSITQPASAGAGPVRGATASGAKPLPIIPGTVELHTEFVPGSHDVEVVARGLPTHVNQLAVLLIPKHTPETAQQAVLRKVSDTDWVARFKDVPAGDYAVAIEPLGPQPPA